MADKCFIVSDQTDDPYLNLAVEQWLLNADSGVRDSEYTLYLWRNSRTVVIGQNQNPYSEVNLDALGADGGHLLRRRTGGGAVYHDAGNLNFSFVVPKALYDQRRQFAVIQRAVESFGLHTELSGRNDILCEGRKFSGNAFSRGRHRDLHHGTLLVDGDMTALQRYLLPKPAKLLKHGVDSVRSRVVNLHELCADVDVDSLAARLKEAFAQEYDAHPEGIRFADIAALPEVLRLRDELASDAWLYGRWQTFTTQRSAQFPWGGVELSLDIVDGVIRDVQIASDALDTDAVAQAAALLRGRRTDDNAPSHDNQIVRDILSLTTTDDN